MNVSTRTSTTATATNNRQSTSINNNKLYLLQKPALMRWFFILLMFVAVSFKGKSQSIANYVFDPSNVTGSLVDMSSGTTPLLQGASMDDVASSNTPLGFNFLFMGTAYSQFSVNTNGAMALSNSGTVIGTSGTGTGTSTTPRIVPFGGDHGVLTTGGKVHYKVTGTAPNRVLIVEWLNMKFNFSGYAAATVGDGTFQAVLHESTGAIEFIYGNMTVATTYSTGPQIGLSYGTSANQSKSIASATLVETNGTTLTSNTYAVGNIANLHSTSDGSRRVFSFTPPSGFAGPTSLNFSAITTVGMTLNWTAASPNTNVLGYAIFNSTDGGTTYNLVGSVAGAASNSFTATGLTPNTTYLWQVYSYSEGTLSSTYAFNPQATNACSISGTKAIGPGGDYANITAAITDLKANGVAGAVNLELNAAYDYTTETYPLKLRDVPCASATNTITIRPALGVTGKSITSANTTATLSLDSAKYYIIDGRQGGTGSIELTIGNTTTAGQPIRFINDASNNIIRYVNVTGSNTSTTGGLVVFSTTNVTGGNGNDNNTIDNCSLNGGGTAANIIYSSGSTTTTATNNSGNTISNNNIFDQFIATGTATNGILVSSGNTDWAITGNSLYQTVSRTFTSGAIHTGINISNSSGNNFVVNNNYIGGSTINAGGTAWTYTGSANRLRGISLSVGSTTPSSVQGNTIANISVTSTSGATGIFTGIYHTAGSANIGTVTGNVIGAATGTGNISVTTSTSGTSYGILNDGGVVSNISNNTIGSLNIVGTAVAHLFTGISVAATTANVNNNTVGSTSTASSINLSTTYTGTTSPILSGIASSATTANITNNTVSNLNSGYLPSPTASSSTIIRGIWVSSGKDSIAGNAINNLSTAANATGNGGSASIIGIGNASTTSGANYIRANTVHSLVNNNASTAVYVTGIYFFGPTTGPSLVDRNLLYNLTSPSPIALVNGINANGATATYQNNMIRLGIDAAGASTVTATNYNGILETAGTNNFWNNTVYIGGTGVNTSPATSTYAFYNNATLTTTRSIRNNIFINERSSASAGGTHYAIRIGGTAPNPAGLTINNNLYRANGSFAGVFGFYNSANVADLAAWKIAVGQDAASIEANPCLANPTAGTPNLHLTDCSGAGSPADGVGFDLGITNDFDNETRSSLTPVDLGADAGNYGVIGVDVGISALVSPVAPVGCYTATETVTVTLKNFGINTIDFSVNPVTVQVTTLGGYTSSSVINSGTLVTNGTQNVTLPATIDMTASGAYQFTSTATVTGDVNNANNSNVTTRTNNSLGGSYNVGAGGAYTTLTAAVAAYNAANCLTGAVIFNLTDAAYTTGETFPIIVNLNSQASATNTLTIKPAAGNTASISGAVASNSLIRLNGSKYVTIDGSNNGTSSRDLTITNSSTTAPTTVSVVSAGLAAGAVNNTVKNCNISTGVSTSASYGIAVGGSTPGSAGADNDNTTIQNNVITIATTGIYANGTTAVTAGADDNLVVSNNNVTTNTTIASIGIQLGNALNSTVSGNTISVTTSASSQPVGISLETGFLSSSVTSNNITNATTSATGGYGGRGITVGTGSATSALTIANNMITGVNGSDWSGFGNSSSMGIALGMIGTSGTLSTVAGGINLYHNTVYMSGSSTSTSATITAALYVGSAVTALDLRNNILVNKKQNGSNAAAKNYAIYSAAANTAFSNIDYNDYSAPDAQGVLGFIGSDRADLAAIQAGFGSNVNSTTVAPVFVSATNLHLVTNSNPTLDNTGTPVGVSTDIDGDSRSGSTPDMGADEFSAPIGVDVGAIALVTPGTNGCYTATETVTIRIKNNSTLNHDFTVDPVTVTATATGGYTGTATINTGTLAPQATLDVVLTPTIDMSVLGGFTFNASATVSGDINTGNDAMAPVTRTGVAPTVGTVSSSVGNYCLTSGRPVLTLSSAAGGTIQWQESTSSATGPWTNVGSDSLKYTAPTNLTATTYYQALVSCGATTATSNVVTVTYNNPQVSSPVPAQRCGTGTVTLSATASAGSTLSWFDAVTGGTALGTGNSFTTPTISATTTYYVSASTPPSIGNVGPLYSGTSNNGTSTGEHGIQITTTKPNTLISSADIPFTGTGTFTITLADVDNVTAISTITTGSVTGSGTTAVTVPIGITVATPGTYTLIVDAVSGTIGSLGYRGSGLTFPYLTPDGSFSVDGGYWYGLDLSSNMYLFNLAVTSSCTSDRTPVVATVNTPPAITASATPAAICIGGSSTLDVTSGNTGYTYQWMPGALSGATQSVSPATTTVYTVTATDASAGPNDGCVTTGTVTVTVNPLPSVITVTPAAPTVCSTPVQLTTTGGTVAGVSILTENFNGPTNSWSNVNNTTTTGSGNVALAAWTLRPDAYVYSTYGTWHSNDNSQFYMSNSDASGSGSVTATILTSPAFSTSGFESANIDFYHYYRSAGTANVEASTDNTNWTLLQSFTTTTGAPGAFAAASIPLTAPFLNQPTVYIRFKYDASWQYFWSIDNININGSQASNMTWSPTAGLFTDAAGTVNYTGTHATSVYALPATQTTYTVASTSQANCQRTQQVTVSLSTLAVSATGTNVLCNGGSTGSITANATGGTIPYQYSIDGTTWQASNTFSVPVGSYTIYAKDANAIPCTVTGNTVVITEPAVLANPISGSTDPVCNNASDGTITAAATGGTAPYAYTIAGPTVNSTGATTGAFTGLASGSYTITVTDFNNCTAISTTVVLNNPASPSISAANNSPVCAGQNVTLTATPGTYTTYAWTGPGTINDANTAIATAATPANGDVFTVTITDANGCTNTATTTVTVNPNLPVSATLTVSPSNEICSASTATFTATATNGGATPNYEFFVNNISVQNGASDTYITSTLNDQDVVTVVVTSSETCTSGSPATSNAITITVAGNVLADVTLADAPTGTVCSGTPVTYTATPTGGGPTPTYEFFVNNVSVQNGALDTYTYAPANGDEIYVVMTSSFDCAVGSPATSATITASVNPTPSAPVVSAGGPTTFCNGGSVTLTSDNPGAGNQWYLDGNPLSGENNPTLVVTASGSYTVTYTSGGCNSAVSNAIAVTVNANPTASISGNSSFCTGGSTLLTANATAGSGTIDTYLWKLNGTTDLGNAATQAASAVGSYTVTVTNSNGCSVTSAAFVITENTPPVAAVSGNCSVLSPGQTATLTATPASGVTYEWTLNGGPVLSTVNPYTTAANAAGTYTVKVTDANGCYDTEDIIISNLSGALVGGTSYVIPSTCGGFPTIASAVTYLNANGVTGTGNVTFNVTDGYTEIAPAGGYALTDSGTASNRIIFQQSGTGTKPEITASATQTVGALNDGIFKLIGADYITISGFTMKENAANTVTTAASNNMTEFGVALMYASATNGASHNIIQNNTISLNRTYQNTFGIYSNATHTATAVTTSATATGADGGNHDLKVYSNNISNVNMGIVVVGPTAVADQNLGVDIGGASAGTGNTLTNYGTTGTFSGYANVSATVNGILVRNTNGVNISYNSVTSSTAGVTAGTLRGIYMPSYSNTPTGTYTTTISNNSLAILTAVVSGTVQGITVESSTASATSTLNVNNNNFTAVGHNVASPTGTPTVISVAAINMTTTINNNTFTNLSNTASTGTLTLVSHNFAIPATGSCSIEGNSIVTALNRTAASGSLILTATNSTSGTGSVSTYINNNFSNITVAGSSTITGFNNTDGGSGSTKTITGNTFNSWTAGTGTVNAFNFSYWNGVSVMSNNNITNITGQGAITGITMGSSASNATSITVANNQVNNLASTGTGGTVTGITCSNTSPLISFSNNTIHTLSSSAASGTVTGLLISGATTAGTTATRNTIYNLTSTGATSPTVRGIAVSSGTLVNVDSNTVYTLSNSGGTAPLLRGIEITGGTTVNIRKNKIYGLTMGGGTSGLVSGILISSGTTVNTINNIIGDLNATTVASTDAVRGINITSTSSSSTQNVYYNTISLNQASTAGANFGTTGIYHTFSTTATSATLNMRNNIVVNNSVFAGTGRAVAFRRSASTNLNNYGAASNNNLFYAGTPGANRLIYYDGTNADLTLGDFKTRVSTRETQSVTENPTFLSTTGSSATFLHIDPSVATQIESGAVNITGITDDYDGNIRQGNPGYTGTSITKPDIGADEFDGTLPPCTGAVGGTVAFPNAKKTVCSGNTAATFSPAGYSVSSGITYQWMESATSSPTGSGYTTNVTGGTGGTTPSYTTAANLAPGTYYYILKVTCSFGEGFTAYSNEDTVVVNQTPTASASNSGPVCSGTSITLTGTTDIGTTFAWSGPAAFTSAVQSPTFTAPGGGSGVYSFTATANGCTSTPATTTVVINETPSAVIVTPQSSTLCEGSVEALVASGGSLVNNTASTIISQDFNAATNNWTTINNSTGGTPADAAWTLRPDAYVYSSYGTWHSNDNSQFYLSNADDGGSGVSVSTILQSPSFSTTGLSIANVNFYHLFVEPTSGSSTGTVEASTDGTNWTTLQTYNSNSPGMSSSSATNVTGATFTAQSIGLTAPFLNQPVVYVRFKFVAGWRYFWGIDNVSVTTPVSAPITWSPIGGLYTDAAATTAYNGEALSTVYAKPNGNATYTATATNLGCSSASTASITINPKPAGASVSGTTAVCAGSTSPVITFSASTGTAPYTFTYNINGGSPLTAVTGSGANPQSVTVSVPTAAAGTFTYNLTGIADIYCSNTATGSATVTVNALPVVSFSGLAGPYCANASAVTLTGSPAGGTFGGPGVSGNSFDPAVAGAGTHSITYTYSDGTCSNSTSQSVTVNALPVVSFTGLPANACIDGAAVTLTGSPAGGTFSGTGVSGNSFDPAVAGVGGPYTITYSYTDGNGCSNSVNHTVTVNALPVVSFTGLAASYCSTDGAVTLTGSPAGGTFSGTGITGNSFNPGTAGAGGPYTITYTYTDGNGCSNSTSQQVTVTTCPTFATLNLKVFLEGFYSDVNTMRSTIFDLGISTDPTETDTISVNLWSAANLGNPAPDYTMLAVLHTNGTATMQFPAAVSGGSWYIAVKHRNHLETWSKLPVSFTATTSYDFSTGVNKAYDDGGNNPMIQMAGGAYAIYGGDVNQDGTVDIFDMIAVDNDASVGAFGYNITDCTGDGGSDLFDMIIIDNNAPLSLFFARPY